jgi:hypothetical protein
VPQKKPENFWASQLAEKLSLDDVLKGHGFIRANKANRIVTALAAEGRFPCVAPQFAPFSASSSAPEGWFERIQNIPPRLKPAIIAPHPARLKPCPFKTAKSAGRTQSQNLHLK